MDAKFNFAKKTLLLLTFSFLLLGCTNETPLDFSEDLMNQSLAFETDEIVANKGMRLHFNTSLKGKNEVPSNTSKAAGQAIVTINKGETMIHYKITTANIENVFASHFHMGAAGTNAGVVATLYSAAPSGPVNGVLAEGDIVKTDLSGALAGKELSELIDAIRSGNIYVNVHTSSIPPGEIRGQL